MIFFFLDDEKIAKEIVRMETDEILAAKLYERETDQLARAYLRARRNGILTEYSDSESEHEEPIITTIEKKWDEFSKGFKSVMDSFTTSVTNTFSPRKTDDAKKHKNDSHSQPPQPQTYTSPPVKEDKDLISSSSDDEDLDNTPLIKPEDRKPSSVK